MIDLLQQLCSIPSVSTDEEQIHKVISLIEQEFEQIHFASKRVIIHNDKPSLLIQNFDGKEADIVLNGHIDVVPASTDDQFEPMVDGDRLYARGAGDMKGGIVVIVEVMKRLLQARYTEKKISLIITSDEEVGGFDGAGYLTSQGYTGKVVLIPDAGGLTEVVVAEKGLMMLEVDVRGVEGHSSRPWLCANALERLFALYQALKDRIEDKDLLVPPHYRSSTVALTKVQGGKAFNMIPGSAQGAINIRHTEHRNRQSLSSVIDDLCMEYGAKRKELLYGDLLYSPDDTSLVRYYQECARQVLGQEVSLAKEHGASDGRFFAAEGAIVLLHRPTCANIHGADEWVQISDIPKLIELYLHFVQHVTV